MPCSTRHLPSLILSAVLCVLWIAQPAAAQSDNDLRRENQRLQSELQDTTRELEAARSRIEELQREVARLERALELARGSRPGDSSPTPPEQVTIDESEPSASPRALLQALTESYKEAMGDVEIGNRGDRTRNVYLRNLSRWQAGATRQFRLPVQWHVRIDDAAPTTSGFDLKLTAVDPQTHAELGDPFEIALPRGMARRYEQLAGRGDVQVLVLRGIVAPRITINPERQTSGPFDNPRLIGPFAEFHLNIEPRSLLAVGEDE